MYCRKGEATYYTCRTCRALYQYPTPDPTTMREYADTEYDHGVYRQYVEARGMKLDHFRNRMQLMRPYLSPGRLLDVGCSCGYFLEVAAAEGYEIQGLEFSSQAIAAAAPEIRLKIMQASVDTLDDEHQGRYAVITAFDIIEHLKEPRAFLARARRLLQPGGAIAISTPDADHWLRPVMGSRWPMLQPMQHLTLFSWKALRLSLEQSGFEVLRLETAYKVLNYGYLIEQIRPLNPVLYSTLGALTRVVPAGVLRRQRQVNIGEVLAIARKVD